MAAGVVPCIRAWAGAAELYPERFVFEDVDEAVASILAGRADRDARAEECRDHARREFDFRVGYERLDALLEDLLA